MVDLIVLHLGQFYVRLTKDILSRYKQKYDSEMVFEFEHEFSMNKHKLN